MTQVLSMPFTNAASRSLLFAGKEVLSNPKASGTVDPESQDADVYQHSSRSGRIKRNKRLKKAGIVTLIVVIVGSVTGGVLGSRKSSTSSSPAASPVPTLIPGNSTDCPTLLNGTVAVAHGGKSQGTDFTLDPCPSFALVKLDQPKSDDSHLQYYLYRKPKGNQTSFDAYDDYIGEVRKSMDGLDNAWNNDGTLQGTTNSSSPRGKVPFIAGSTKSLLDFLTGKTAQYPNFDPPNTTDQAGIVERAEDGQTANIFAYQFNPDGTLAEKKKIGTIKNHSIEIDPASPEAATLASYIANLKPGRVLRKK